MKFLLPKIREERHLGLPGEERLRRKSPPFRSSRYVQRRQRPGNGRCGGEKKHIKLCGHLGGEKRFQKGGEREGRVTVCGEVRAECLDIK